MTTTQATAEVFWTAFKVLPVEEKRAVLQKIILDENLRRDLMDLSIIEERRNEPGHPLREHMQTKSPKILSVQPLDERKLLVQFANGIDKIYNCKPLIEKFEPFQPLENEVFFKQVKVDAGGYGISWNDKVDLSEYELWVNSVEVVKA